MKERNKASDGACRFAALVLVFCMVGRDDAAGQAPRPYRVAPSTPLVVTDDPEPVTTSRWSWPEWNMPESFTTATRGVSGHLVVGTRMVAYSLLQPDGDFLGSIDHLDEEQDLLPTRIFANWLVLPYWGFEATWDRVQMSTITTADGHADGDIVLDGPILTVFGRYPNASDWTPFVGLGLAFYSGSFEPETWWRLHYPSELDWIDFDRPQVALGGITKDLAVDDAVAFVVTAGTEARLTEHLSANLYGRLTWGNVNTHYTILEKGELLEDRGDSDFPFDNIALGLGITYRF